jgi:hypothetical protein
VVHVHPDAMTSLDHDRRPVRPMPPRGQGGTVDTTNLTLRLDRAGDASRLYQLAALSERRLAGGAFVLAEIDGRLVAALPVDGGEPLADPFVPTAHLLPLLRLRATQIRRVEVRPQRLRRVLLARRA